MFIVGLTSDMQSIKTDIHDFYVTTVSAAGGSRGGGVEREVCANVVC